MEAIDTVIDLDKYLNDMGWVLSKDGMQYAWLKQALSKQAEITFPKGERQGYEKGLREQGSPRADLENELADEEFRKEYHIARKETDMELFKAGEKQGIDKGRKEVVEWGKRNNLIPPHINGCYGVIQPSPNCPNCNWQAFKKKLGL